MKKKPVVKIDPANVEPLSKKEMEKIYAKREDDIDSIQQMIAAQPALKQFSKL